MNFKTPKKTQSFTHLKTVSLRKKIRAKALKIKLSVFFSTSFPQSTKENSSKIVKNFKLQKTFLFRFLMISTSFLGFRTKNAAFAFCPIFLLGQVRNFYEESEDLQDYKRFNAFFGRFCQGVRRFSQFALPRSFSKVKLCLLFLR